MTPMFWQNGSFTLRRREEEGSKGRPYMQAQAYLVLSVAVDNSEHIDYSTMYIHFGVMGSFFASLTYPLFSFASLS